MWIKATLILRVSSSGIAACGRPFDSRRNTPDRSAKFIICDLGGPRTISVDCRRKYGGLISNVQPGHTFPCAPDKR